MPGQIFVTRLIPRAGLRRLEEAGAQVRVGESREEHGLDPDVLESGLAEADVLVSLLTEPLPAELLQQAPRLRGIANYAVGYDNVDVAAATRLGIPVSNTPDVLTDTTADLTWAALLAAARRIAEADRYMREARYRIWGPELLLGRDVGPGGSGWRKVLGIVGFGRIGEAVARRAVGFDMEVRAYDPHQRERIESFGEPVAWAELDELLRSADIVSLHAPLTPATHHLIGEPELRSMKPDALLVNVARGPIVDESALVRALREGWIMGAALDVYEHEPDLAAGLAECPNALLLPHIGSASRDTRDRMAIIAANNALAHLEGRRAPDAVNPQVYESEAWRRRVERA